MAITKQVLQQSSLTVTPPQVVQLTEVADFAGPASYNTGGEALTFAAITTLHCIVFEEPSGSYFARYDRANAKVLFYNTSDGAQVTAATDLSSLTWRFLAIGEG